MCIVCFFSISSLGVNLKYIRCCLADVVEKAYLEFKFKHQNMQKT